MTSDAKIGLLLGLVCIFIIAFVINGLPRFRNVVSSNELTTTMNDIVGTENGAVGIGSNERNAPGVFDWEETVTEEVSPVVAQEDTGYMPPWSRNTFVTGDNLADEVYNNDFQENNLRQTYDIEQGTSVPDSLADQEQVRFQMSFPFNVSATEEVSISESENRTEYPTNEQPAVRGFSFSNGQNRFQNPRVVQSAQSAQPQTYTVQEGDGNLSNIAKKFYGEEEGNRLVNVNRIFEANRKILRSADEIFVGQTLVIPPLPDAPASSPQSGGLFGSDMFQRIRSIGSRTETRRWYEVQEDDSLWKIAAEQLGEGSRYTEISKLNADILTNEDKLRPGMRLQLPAQ
jgi:nucleoid-associated protein YgaU